jgi:aspartate ammonia-lyase
VEPGSSIMPGKVNPSVPEAVQMACYETCGNDHAIALAAAAGELELNVMTPLVAHDLGESFDLLTRALRLLRERAVEGLTVDRARVDALVRGSLVQATGLSPYLGYDVTAELVKEALSTRRPFADIVRSHRLVPPAVLTRLLAPAEQTRPRPVDVTLRRRIQSAPAFRAYRARPSGQTVAVAPARKPLSGRAPGPYSSS